MAAEPALTGFIYATVSSHNELEEAICHRIAQRLGHADVDAGLIVHTFHDVAASQPDLARAFRADLAAVLDRDPAATRYLEPFLYFKGFHALVTYRFEMFGVTVYLDVPDRRRYSFVELVEMLANHAETYMQDKIHAQSA